MTPLAGATRMPTPGLFTMLLLLITSFAGPARRSLIAVVPEPTTAFSMYTLAAAWMSIGPRMLNPFTAIFLSMTVFPGALIVIAWALKPPPPARQSIVTERDMVGDPKKPASTH